MADVAHLENCSPAKRRSLVRTHRQSLQTDSFAFVDVVHGGASRLPWHLHSRPMLVVLARGGYTHVTGRRRVECLESEVVFVPAGEPHREEIGDRPARAHLMVPLPGGERLDLELPTKLHRFRPEEIGPAASHLGVELEAAGPSPVLEASAYELLATVGGLISGRRSRAPAWLNEARRLLGQRFSEELDLASISADVGISRSQLCRGFRRWYGRSVWDYLGGVRLERAADLLGRSRQPISEIALECGFYDQSHFGNRFRQRFGLSPARFRKSRSA